MYGIAVGSVKDSLPTPLRSLLVCLTEPQNIKKKLNTTEIGNIELEIPLIKTDKKNKNDLIFFILLFTYISLFIFYKKNNAKK